MTNNSSNTTNNNKNGPATAIPPNTEAEDLIKSNKSTMQQLIQANDTIVELKEQLLDREARLMAMQQAINQVLSQVATDSNTLYKEINKNLVILSDMVKGFMEPQLQQTFTAIRTQIPAEKKRELSYEFRKGEGLPPLNLGVVNSSAKPKT